MVICSNRLSHWPDAPERTATGSDPPRHPALDQIRPNGRMALNRYAGVLGPPPEYVFQHPLKISRVRIVKKHRANTEVINPDRFRSVSVTSHVLDRCCTNIHWCI